jgi:hypothetical protein
VRSDRESHLDADLLRSSKLSIFDEIDAAEARGAALPVRKPQMMPDSSREQHAAAKPTVEELFLRVCGRLRVLLC